MPKAEKNLLKARLALAGAIVAGVAALFSALQMQGRVRTVDILTLFAGGFGAGVGVVGAVVEWKRARERAANGGSR